MTDRVTPSLLSSATGALPGTWKLVDGRAFTLRPATDGILRVGIGRLWATRDGPHGSTPDEAGDHMLEAGRAMFVRAGERVVVEAWTPGAAACFAWDPMPASLLRARTRLAALRQPLADLRTALVLATTAVGALAHGLVQVAWGAVGGGRRGLPARRPHGATG